MSADCGREDLRVSLGSLVLDALEPDEAREVRQHLASCPECQVEYNSLLSVRAVMDTGLVGGMAQVRDRMTAPRAVRVVPVVPVVPGARVAEERPPVVKARRRKFTLVLAGAVASAVAVVTFGVFSLTGGGSTSTAISPPSPPSHTVTGTTAQGVTASISYREAAWGTWVQITMSHVPWNYNCTLTVVGKDGHTQFASSWSASPDGGSVTVPGGVAMPLSEIAVFDVDLGHGKDLTINVPPST
jgi:hypothetical protein